MIEGNERVALNLKNGHATHNNGKSAFLTVTFVEFTMCIIAGNVMFSLSK